MRGSMVYTELAPRRQHVAGKQRCKYTVSIGYLDGYSKRAVQLLLLFSYSESCVIEKRVQLERCGYRLGNNNAVYRIVKRLGLISR